MSPGAVFVALLVAELELLVAGLRDVFLFFRGVFPCFGGIRCASKLFVNELKGLYVQIQFRLYPLWCPVFTKRLYGLD